MKRPTIELIYHGVIGGILAGLVVVLWFLVVDSFHGTPFQTPAALASTIFDHHPAEATTLRLIAMYSVLHFAVFAVLGVCAAWMVEVLHATPRLLLGLFFGIVVQELFFYTGLILTGLAPSGILPWQHVIGANMVSGLALMAYLHRASRAELPLGLAALRVHPLLSRALMTGLVGAAAVALWFFFIDVIEIPAIFFLGFWFAMQLLSGVGQLASVSGANVGFWAHIGGFVTGLGGVFVFRTSRALALFLVARDPDRDRARSRRRNEPRARRQWVLGTVGIWSVLVGNVLAVGAMGWYVCTPIRSGTAAGVARSGLETQRRYGQLWATHALPNRAAPRYVAPVEPPTTRSASNVLIHLHTDRLRLHGIHDVVRNRATGSLKHPSSDKTRDELQGLDSITAPPARVLDDAPEIRLTSRRQIDVNSVAVRVMLYVGGRKRLGLEVLPRLERVGGTRQRAGAGQPALVRGHGHAAPGLVTVSLGTAV
jgi:hypothetical protein